ncbi:MAG: hypothetical protein ACK4F9_06140 [Brevinematia bacterium]
MKRFLVFVVLLLLFYDISFSDELNGFDNRLSKVLLGVNFSYINYTTLENDIGLNIDDNRFLLGFSLGYVSRGVIVDFIYAYKVYPFSVSTLNQIKVIDYFDVFTFIVGYLFTLANNYFYLGPTLVFSIDNSYLKIFNDIDFNTYNSYWNVKEIHSRVFSIGCGVNFVVFRNVFLGGYYLYSFPNTYYYQGVNIMNSPNFSSTGLRISLSLTL